MQRKKRFNPHMLHVARLSREMTQGELAEKAQVTQGRVSKVENGLREPPDALIQTFAKVLGYPTSFFFQEGGIQTLPIAFFRKRTRVPRRVLDRIQAYITIYAMNLATLLDATDIHAEVAVPQLDSDDVGDAGDVARAVRQLWGMPAGPVENLVDTVERAGVVVIPWDFGVDEVDAIGMRHPQLPPLMFVNASAPTDRMRFTLAHELGHLVMHELPSESMERDANLFAAEFLMPERDIRPHLRNLSLPVLGTLKRIWRVSMAALLHRARELGTISKRRYESLWKLLTAYGYRKREPADLDPPRENPTLLERLIAFHREGLRYTTDQLARVFHLHQQQYVEQYELATRPLRLVG